MQQDDVDVDVAGDVGQKLGDEVVDGIGADRDSVARTPAPQLFSRPGT